MFFGSGLSQAAGLPVWNELFKELAMQLKLDISELDCYDIAQYFCNTYSKSDLTKKITSALSKPVGENTLIDAFINFAPTAIWTTNYDTLIENALLFQKKSFNLVYHDHDLTSIAKKNNITIYKMNGDIHHPSRMILTANDWQNYPDTHPTMITFLKKELVSNSFLFYGYSFKDNLVKTLLSSILKFVGENSNLHFSIQKRSDDAAFNCFINDLKIRYNVETLLVDSYDEVPQILADIEKEVYKSNIFISG